MRDEMALAEWRRAKECLDAAWHCASGGFYADAISRAYYAVLHAAKAVLQLRGIDARSHMGIMSLFGSSIVRLHLIEGHWNDETDLLHALRIRADYNVEVRFVESDALDACQRAQAFLHRIGPSLAGVVPVDEA